MLFLTVFCAYLVGASAYVLPFVPLNDGRIVGGVESSIEERPFSASLQYVFSSSVAAICGGSILSENYVLSAAHCLVSGTMHVRVGSSDYSKGGQSIEVSKFSQHPQYYRPTLDYDFAVLTLRAPIVMGPVVVPVVLPKSTADDPQENDITTVSGWGVTSESSGNAPLIIRQVDLPAWSNAKCSAVYSFITARQICLGGTPQGGTSACFGDSGGPVTFNGVQVALVSGGNSCSAPNIPGIYGKLTSVLDWIKEQADL